MTETGGVASHDGAGRGLGRGVLRLPGRLAGRAAHPDQVRLTVLGGSSPATVQLVEALASDEEELPYGLLGPVELVLHGRSQTRLAAVARAARMRVRALGLRMPIRAQVSRAAALDGASIVLNQIRPGGLAGRSFDESFPQAFGLPGEETLGPGGLSCAVRAVPALRPIWADVARYSEGALLINLTNPAGIVTQAAQAEFGLPVVSVCDSPLDLLRRAAARLGGGPPTEITLRTRYLGMNHVGWLNPSSTDELAALTGLVAGIDPELPLLHGAVPSSYLRYYVHPDRMLAAQRGRPTRAEELREIAESSLRAFGHGAVPANWRRPAPWYSLAVVPLARAWLRGSQETLILGLPNAGRVPWLPDDVIVEGPAMVPGPGQIRSLPAAGLPDLPRGILARHAAFERLVAVTLAAGPPDRGALVRMLLANPLVTSLDQARGLAAAIAARPAGEEDLVSRTRTGRTPIGRHRAGPRRR